MFLKAICSLLSLFSIDWSWLYFFAGINVHQLMNKQKIQQKLNTDSLGWTQVVQRVWAGKGSTAFCGNNSDFVSINGYGIATT